METITVTNGQHAPAQHEQVLVKVRRPRRTKLEMLATPVVEKTEPKKRGRKPGVKNKEPVASASPVAKVAKPAKPKAVKTEQSFVPLAGLAATLDVLSWAEGKYRNKPWQARGESSQSHAMKAMSHLVAHLKGETKDKESGKRALAHAAARLLIALSL